MAVVRLRARSRQISRPAQQADARALRGSEWRELKHGGAEPGTLGEATMVSRWQGSRLITTITLPATAEGGAATYEESRWLNPDGTMVVEIRRIGGPGLRRSIYRKTGR